MISKVLWYIQNGAVALTLHTKFILIILVIFLFPLGFLFSVQTIQQVADNNTKTVQKESVAVLHEALQIGPLKENTARLLAEEFNSPTTLQVYKTDDLNQTELQFSSGENAAPIDQHLLATTPSDGSVYIYEQEENGARVWYAVSKTRTEGHLYTIASIHNYRLLDQVLASRILDVYWFLGLGLLLLFLIAYWLVRQTNWEAKYQSIQTNLSQQELLMGTIAHEFRSPLTAIAGNLSFLHESNRLRPKDKETLRSIGMSTQRMLHLVNDFLEVSKIQSGRIDLTFEKVNLNEVIYRVITEQGVLAAEKRLILRDATQRKDIQLLTDKKRLVQVLTNIVNNALKYTEKGSIVITYESNPLYVTLRVQDTGTGISAADRDKLFEPFSRVGGVEKTAAMGSGLGMWITKRLVETLGGKIAVESIYGIGTHVVLRFDTRKIAAKARDGIL